MRDSAEYSVYSREQLLALRPMGRRIIVQTIPAELKRKYRGCRAGAKLKARKTEKRWRYKPSVPSVVMGNVNSLTNKTDELACLVKNQRLYRECSLFCFTETWLTTDTPDANVELPGFSTVRADRDPTLSGKRKGGGLALFINTRWCNPGHVNVKEVICCRDIKLLAVSLRPYYMPRELSHAIVVCVYIPPRAEVQAACDVIHSTFVDCPTRKNRTIDLLYANVRDAYRATPLPPLGKSDHNLVFLQPQYKPLVLRQPTTTRSFRVWSPEAEEALKDCYDTTDWSVLLHPHGEDIEEVTHCVTDYLNFCMDVAVPTKTVRCFPNNKPWITSDVKDILNQKKRAFKDGNWTELKRVQGELKVRLKEAKESYRKKVERKLQDNNMKEVWGAMKTITGCKNNRGSSVDGGVDRANQFNNFYNRFDCPAPAAPSSNPSAAFTTLSSPPSLSPPPSPPPSQSSPPPPPPPTPPSAGRQSNSHSSHSPPTFTADQVRRQLRRLHPRKAAGPDRVCPRMLKACAAQLGEPLQHVFNLSLCLGRVPATWKTTCLIPVPKKAHPKELNDYRPVALTSHVMKTMERLLLNHLRPQVHHAEDPLQFAYREKVGVEDAILYLLHRAHSHLDKGGCAVRVMFFDFSSAFNTIQPLLLRDKLMKMEVDMHLVTWITDYLTGRPQHVRIRDCTSDTVISSTGAPQGTVLSPVLFTLYTSDFKYNSELCHMQKFSDDTAIVGCVRNGQEREYRSLVEDFVEWCTTNHLKLNITKTKEMCIDFRRSRPSQQPISIKGVDVEVVRSYRYLGVHLDERLDWSVNTDMVYKKAQSRLYFLRRLGSFRICQKLLLMFYQSVVASILFYAVVCWGGSISKRDAGRLDRLVRKAGSVLGLELESLTPLAERRALSKLLHIMDNVHHPLHSTIIRQRSSFSGRLLSQSCSTDRLRKSFVPQAIRLFNSSQYSK
ncbi:hypothetical protein NFI96_024792 [Prochilodus magdalenae]|nr:hypothetical protein NFI96_024792 [Prochilodus magdalenae]